jgi:signal transduction histidine kinase
MRNSNNRSIENGTQYQPIKKKEITREVVTARQKERVKIAMEIQENLNQVLVAALLYIELAKTDDKSRAICLDKSSSFISLVINEFAIMSQTLKVRGIAIKK